WCKELPHPWFSVFVPDVVVVSAIGQKQLFVGAQERRCINQSLVPDDDNPTIRPQDSFELFLRFGRVEPVKCLAGDDEIDARVIKCRRFSRAVDALKVLRASENRLSNGTHRCIWLDANHMISFGKE